MTQAPKLKQRTRAGSYRSFECRYGPLPGPDGSMMRDWRDPRVQELFDQGDEGKRHVWTVVEGDTGRLYLVPGFATVNYMGRVVCTRPWPEGEQFNPGYTY